MANNDEVLYFVMKLLNLSFQIVLLFVMYIPSLLLSYLKTLLLARFSFPFFFRNELPQVR